MAGRMIGVEIGNDSVKLAVVSGGQVQRVAVERLPDNMVLEGNITSADAMSNFIRKMRKTHRIPGGNCALVLPYRPVITNMVTMPPMSDAELQMNLPFEFRDYVGPEGAKYHYDYAVMDVINDQAGQPEKVEVFAAAVRKELIEKNYAMLKKAGLTMKVALPQEMAWLNLVRKATSEPSEICIVDVGHTVTRVFLYADGKFVMGRELEIGGQLLDEAIAADQQVDAHIARRYKETNLNNVLSSPNVVDGYTSLAVEVMKVVNFYANFSGHDANLGDIYYCGGQSAVEGLRTAIKKATNLTAHHICRLVPGGFEDQETLCTALAAAAALG